MSLVPSMTFFLGNGRRRKSADAAPSENMLPLLEAAANVLAEMRKRRYALAEIAHMNRAHEEACAWVAENMAQNVPVYEKDDSGWHRAATGAIAGRALFVPPSSIDAYLKWAKSTY